MARRPDRQTERQTVLWKKNWCFFLRALSTSAQSLQHSLGFGFKSGFGFGFWFGFGWSFGSGFVFVFGSGLGLSRGFWHGQHWLTEGLSPVTSYPARAYAHSRGKPTPRCSWQSSAAIGQTNIYFRSFSFKQCDGAAFLFFTFCFFFIFFYLFFFASLAGQPQSLVVFSQPQAHSHFKLKIRKKHSGAHAQQRPTCRRNGQRWRTGAKGCCCSCFCSCSCCREKRKKKFLLPPLAAVSLGSRRNKKEIKAKNWVGWKFVYPLHTVPSPSPPPNSPIPRYSLSRSLSQFFLCLSSWPE